MWKIFVFCFLALLFCVAESAPRRRKTRFQINFKAKKDAGIQNCGYDACQDLPKDKLNVHLVAHTHDDVGWLKTVDQYYYGNKGVIQKAGVQYILDSVVSELLKDANKRFIYVESAFFFRWYNEQTKDLQDKVKMLVEEGRLEFIGGAYSMNDEAASHYHSVIDQFTWGLHLLKETFGECGRPRIGWQIDPFGHSSEMASMLAQMDYDGLFLGRLDYEDKKWRLSNKTMEMIWHSANLKDSDIFTAGLYNIYAPPPGFCFDVLCDDEPFNDDPESSDFNVDSKIDDFVNYVKNMSASFRTNHVILTMGEDFHYQDANMWYKNLDKLIFYANERQAKGSDINVFYSTPTCYLKALHDANIEWPTKENDFFPYASDPHSYWTGYYTSRPNSKRFERVGNNFLQVCKQLTALAPKKEPEFDDNLDSLREVMGIMQHHDAITGTEKQHVADDYHFLLHKAIDSCTSNARQALNQLFNNEKENICVSTMEKNSCHAKEKSTLKIPKLNFEICHNLNISMCEITESGTEFLVTVYNPKGRISHEYLRLPVDGGSYTIKDSNGEIISSQLVPIPDSVGNLNFRISSALFELVFLADQLPALGYKSFLVTKNSDEKINIDLEDSFEDASGIHIGNDVLSITFNENGLLDTITANGASSKLTQNFIYYESMIGNNREPNNRSSGAYIFRPDGEEKYVNNKAELKVVKGLHVQEVHQNFNDWISQVIRVYAKSNHVEFEWMVGPIPIEDGIGKEIVSRFESVIKNDGIFYTDSNGREMLKRVRNHRDDWPLTVEESISSNYYPVTTKIAIDSDIMRMAVLTDRAQGGTSMKDGSIDLMIHRRILRDDAFGVGEALNETAFGNGLVARGKHYLMFGHKNVVNPTIKARERILQSNIMLSGAIFLTNDVKELNNMDLTEKVNFDWTAAVTDLPENVNLLTFEPWTNGTTLIRFENFMEKDDDPLPVKFDMRQIFDKFVIEDLKETNLAANQMKTESKRLQFKSYSKHFDHEVKNKENSYEVTLGPMEIKTFIANMTYKF